MNLVEKTLQKNYVYNGRIINVRSDDAVLPDGKACKREVVEHHGGAAVFCEMEEKIAFVRQYRYAYQKEVLEIPAGKLEKGEDPESAARRELAEETGVISDNFTKIAEVYPSPGYTNEIIYVYRAQEGKRATQHLDKDEFLSVEWLTIEETKKMLLNGEFHDSKTIIALQDYFLKKLQ